jgi:endoglucanase
MLLILTAAVAVSPSDFVASMGIGINLGNTLDAPTEGSKAPAAKETYFDQYKAAGFGSVRVPCRWSEHISWTAPYIDTNNTFLTRVHEVVGWSTSRGLRTIINTHHDDWLDNSTSGSEFAHNLEILVAIWTTVGKKFADVPDDLLAFEVYNEPHFQMTTEWLNMMYKAVLPAIRATNPTRTVFLGGLNFMNPTWITGNPNAIDMLPVPTPTDPYLALEVHSYGPFDFCGDTKNGPTSHSYKKGDVAKWAAGLYDWSTARNVSVLLGEFGCTTRQSNREGRVKWYELMREKVTKHGFAAAVWDDSGHFGIFDREAGTWDSDVLYALGLGTPPVEEVPQTVEEMGRHPMEDEATSTAAQSVEEA